MKKKIFILIVCVSMTITPFSKSRADFWGADIPLLTQILANTIKQLIEMRNLVSNARSRLNLIREINRGINDSLNMARIINPNLDPGLYREWHSIQQALGGVQAIYGPITDSPQAKSQQNTDQTVAEAIRLNNELYDHAAKLDSVAESIKHYSHQVSPGGAQKLTAQSNGVMLQVLNQSLRAQATGLKLQAQNLALENQKEKRMTTHILVQSGKLSHEMKKADPDFKVPRF